MPPPRQPAGQEASSSQPSQVNWQEQLDNALAHINKYTALIQRLESSGPIEGPHIVVARTSEQAMDWAQAGLDALENLRGTGTNREQRRKQEKFLKDQLSWAACRFLIVRPHQYETLEILKQPIPTNGPEVLAYRTEIERQLTEYRKSFARTRDARKAVMDGRRNRIFTDQGADNADYWALHHSVVDSLRIALLLHRMMSSCASDFDDEIQSALDLQDIWMRGPIATIYNLAIVILDREEVDPELAPGALEDMKHVCLLMESGTQQMSLAVVQALNEDSDTWRIGEEYVRAADEATSSHKQLIERVKNLLRKTESRQSSSSRVALGQPDSTPSSSAGTAQSSSTRRKPRGSVTTSSTGTQARTRGNQHPRGDSRPEVLTGALAKAAPLPDKRTLALKDGQKALMRSPVTRDMAENGDAEQIARFLQLDTRTVDLLRHNNNVDPQYIAQCVQSSLPKWFGDVNSLRSAHRALASLPETKTGDPELVQLSAALADRIAALEVLSNQVTRREWDEIKRYSFPGEKHLERLLALQELAEVAPPVMLPSHETRGDAGTLFEIAVTPKPLNNGAPAPRLYIHLHTCSPMTADAVRGNRDMRKFSAVHVKTEAQKALGARWEEMQRRLGRDVKVHRGRINNKLLKDLLDMANRPQAQQG
ncbi:MAG TPA: hypothetical protein VFP68_08385 [Burkholderiaceae bacterium]|nr:hypothetical protein [Burkholderiaceae bacterium]